MSVNFGGGRDSFTHVSHNSVCGKLFNSFVGVFIGLAMFVAGFPLLAWNENNFIRVYESLAEGLQKVETVEDINFIDHAMQGQLVHVAGPLGNVPVLEDAEMGLSIRGTSLDRVVEMYQWVQKTHKRKSNKRTVTTYTYELEWADQVVDSSNFAQPGYDNPRSMPIQPLSRSASGVKLGAFNLKQSQLDRIGSRMYVPLTPETLLLKDATTGQAAPKSSAKRAAALPDPVQEQDPYGDDGFDYDAENDPVNSAPAPRRSRKASKKSASRHRGSKKRGARSPARRRSASGLVPAAPGAQDLVLSGDALYLADDPSNPHWGDARVTWRVRNPQAATVIGVQRGSDIRPYKASNGYTVHIVQEGQLTAEEAFEGAHSENSMLTWFLRAGGYLLMAIGLRMVLEPAVVAPQLIPLIGGFVSSIVACGACMASMSMALVFTLVTVAIAWFAVRPTLSITLLALAGATALFASLFRKNNATATNNAQKND